MYEIALQTDADTKIVDALMDEAFGLNRHARSVWNLRPGAPIAEMCFVLRDNSMAVGSLRFWEVMLVLPMLNLSIGQPFWYREKLIIIRNLDLFQRRHTMFNGRDS